MSEEILPILYSFRRCPYAMRARMALHYSGINCYIREVSLRNKPSSLLEISPKATVPVLQFNDGSILEESMDIINYSLTKHDPENILLRSSQELNDIKEIIENNDSEFVIYLRKYKYFERYPEKSQEYYREIIETKFLEKYEKMLAGREFLFGKKSAADIAILPFIRQFAFADEDWFFKSKYENIIDWLNRAITDDVFENIILAKLTPWQKGDKPIKLFGDSF